MSDGDDDADLDLFNNAGRDNAVGNNNNLNSDNDGVDDENDDEADNEDDNEDDDEDDDEDVNRVGLNPSGGMLTNDDEDDVNDEETENDEVSRFTSERTRNNEDNDDEGTSRLTSERLAFGSGGSGDPQPPLVTLRSGDPQPPLVTLRSGDPQSPLVAFDYATLSRLRESGVSAATALALLQEAVRIGKTSVISVILETYQDQKLDLNAIDSLGKTPLFWSVMHGIPDISRLLIAHGADINKATLTSRSLLHWAAWQGNEQVILCLLQNGADPNAFDIYSKTPLHLCCESLNLHGCCALLDYGADASLTDSDDCEPLHLVCANGGVRIAEMILNRCRVDVDALSQNGTPLHLACKFNHVSLVRLLVAHGANVNSLHPAVIIGTLGGGGAAAATSLPLAPRFSPMSSVFSDWSTSASKDEYSMLLILEFLLREGALLHWRGIDNSVEMPIVGAVRGGFESCALLLVRHGSPTDVTIDGTSLLLKACQQKMEGLVDALLAMGIDLGDEQWLFAPDHPDSLAEELDILLFLRETRLKSPYSLRTFAAAAIRRRIARLTNQSFLDRFDDLPLPKSLKADLKGDQIDLRKYVKITDLD